MRKLAYALIIEEIKKRRKEETLKDYFFKGRSPEGERRGKRQNGRVDPAFVPSAEEKRKGEFPHAVQIRNPPAQRDNAREFYISLGEGKDRGRKGSIYSFIDGGGG